MPNLFGKSSPNHPPPDIHNKLQAEQPDRGKTDIISNVLRTLSASKALDQILGIRNLNPMIIPPAMSSSLMETFESGLRSYEQLYAARVFPSNGSDGCVTSAPSKKRGTTLTDIREETESPVRIHPFQGNTTTASSTLEISVPKWKSGKQVVATAQRSDLLDSDSEGESSNDTVSQLTEYESDEDYISWEHGSSTTLEASDSSRSGSAASGHSLPTPSYPPRTSSLHPLPNFSSSEMTALPSSSSRIKKLSKLRSATTRSVGPGNSPDFRHSCIDQSNLNRSESLPILFSSPGFVSTTKVSDHNKVAYGYASEYVQANAALYDGSVHSSQHAISLPLPRIMIQAPSPVKSTQSRKRTLSSTAQEKSCLPVARRFRGDDTIGLPVLPPEAEAIWKTEFRGNTPALLTILLTWSHMMWILYSRLHEPKLFSGHPAFAYPVMPPVKKQLFSASFYDSSIEPHREIRFLGPGDVAEMSYHEVDVFEDPSSKTQIPASPQQSSPIDAIKQILKLTKKESSTHVRYISMSQRAKTGEGRWCYILIKGNNPSDGSTPPHLMLAWHISAVTSTSNCLHTLYTNDAVLNPDTPIQNKVKRFSSLQNIGQALRSPTKFNFHLSLRTASSSSELPLVDPYTTPEQREGLTLHRTVIKLEKTGAIPLIEGYRVDVVAFQDWMEACGKGNGKVILWRELGTV